MKFSQAIKRICNFTCPVRTSKAGSLFAVLLLCTDTPDTVVVVVLILPSIPATVVVVVVILIFIFLKRNKNMIVLRHRMTHHSNLTRDFN